LSNPIAKNPHKINIPIVFYTQFIPKNRHFKNQIKFVDKLGTSDFRRQQSAVGCRTPDIKHRPSVIRIRSKLAGS